MEVSRRGFLKFLGLTAAVSVINPFSLLPAEGHGIQIKYLGRVLIGSPHKPLSGIYHEPPYKAERFCLWKNYDDGELLEVYCHIDADLVNLYEGDEKKRMIKEELTTHIEGMKMVEKQRYPNYPSLSVDRGKYGSN